MRKIVIVSDAANFLFNFYSPIVSCYAYVIRIQVSVTPSSPYLKQIVECRHIPRPNWNSNPSQFAELV